MRHVLPLKALKADEEDIQEAIASLADAKEISMVVSMIKIEAEKWHWGLFLMGIVILFYSLLALLRV